MMNWKSRERKCIRVGGDTPIVRRGASALVSWVDGRGVGPNSEWTTISKGSAHSALSDHNLLLLEPKIQFVPKRLSGDDRSGTEDLVIALLARLYVSSSYPPASHLVLIQFSNRLLMR